MNGVNLRRKFWRKTAEKEWRRWFKNYCFWRKRSWRIFTFSYQLRPATVIEVDGLFFVENSLYENLSRKNIDLYL